MDKMTALKKIGTHSGTFHADESLACFLLLQTKEFRNSEIVRSRDPSVLENLDILVDVGSVYDPKVKRFDHHQREFKETFDDKHKTRLSSAGLIYKHFGREVLSNLIEQLPEIKTMTPAKPSKLGDSDLEKVYQLVYDNFVEMFDGNDNGIPMYPSVLDNGEKLVAAYKDRTSLPSRVSRLNTAWNDSKGNDSSYIDSRFKEAMQLVGQEFKEAVEFLVRSWLPARVLVEKAFSERKQVDASGKIIYFPQHCPWKEHLFTIEKERSLPDEEKPVYAIFQDTQGMWRIQSIPLTSSSFDNRLPLPVKWRGLRDEYLKKESGVEGVSFVHAAGFIGGANSKDAVLAMAKISLNLGKPKF